LPIIGSIYTDGTLGASLLGADEGVRPYMSWGGSASGGSDFRCGSSDPRVYNPFMSLTEQIQKDIVTAMKAKDEARLSTLRMVKSALQLKQVEKMAPLDDKESQAVLTTLIKQRKESVDQFTKGGRQEMADKEAAEIVVIESYMPKAAGEAEIVAGVKAAIAEMGSPTMKEMGTVMKNAMAKFNAASMRVDGKTVSEIVKRELAGK
jgi:uncharacterized protein YqeY